MNGYNHNHDGSGTASVSFFAGPCFLAPSTPRTTMTSHSKLPRHRRSLAVPNDQRVQCQWSSACRVVPAFVTPGKPAYCRTHAIAFRRGERP